MTFVKRPLSLLALAATLIAPQAARADDAGKKLLTVALASAEADLSLALGMQEKVDRPDFLDGRKVKDSQAYQ